MDHHKEEGHVGQNNVFHIFYIHAGNRRVFIRQIPLSNCGVQGTGLGMEGTVRHRTAMGPAQRCLHSRRTSRHSNIADN